MGKVKKVWTIGLKSILTRIKEKLCFQPNFNSTSIGFELEYEQVFYYSCSGRLIDSIGKFGKIKNDSSLIHGFEFASNVFQFKDFLCNPNSKLASIFEGVNKFDVEIVDYTGLHFHINRKALTAVQWHDVNKFVSTNNNFVVNISGRNFNFWCPPTINTIEEFNNKRRYRPKYQALNPNGNNGKTVEMRFFCSTANYDTFMGRAQFAIALVEAARKNALKNVQIFVDFVHENGYNYPQLKAILNLQKSENPSPIC